MSRYEFEREFSKKLKNGLDNLSDSVNCFDKISNAVYSKNSMAENGAEHNFSEMHNEKYANWHTVNGADTVVKKSCTKKHIWRSTLAVAAACCLILTFGAPLFFSTIPNIGFWKKGSENIAAQQQKEFNAVYQELKSELENVNKSWNYVYEDYSENEYNASSLFINPLCMYNFSGNNNSYIRVYTKVYYSSDEEIVEPISTNQVYLVKYNVPTTTQLPSADSILAIVDTKAKFTINDAQTAENLLELARREKSLNIDLSTYFADPELQETFDAPSVVSGIDKVSYIEDGSTVTLSAPYTDGFEAVVKTFVSDEAGSYYYVTAENKFAVNVGAFSYTSLYKSDNDVNLTVTPIIYYNLQNLRDYQDSQTVNIAYDYYPKTSKVTEKGVVSFNGLYDDIWNDIAINQDAEYNNGIQFTDEFSALPSESVYFRKSKVERGGVLEVSQINVTAPREFDSNDNPIFLTVTTNGRIISQIRIPMYKLPLFCEAFVLLSDENKLDYSKINFEINNDISFTLDESDINFGNVLYSFYNNYLSDSDDIKSRNGKNSDSEIIATTRASVNNESEH